MNSKLINVERDFSKYPAGRYIADGPYSGEAFREKLVAALQGSGEVVVELDGARGYGSSFLEEAFGGLIRAGISPDAIKTRLMLKSQDKSLI